MKLTHQIFRERETGFVSSKKVCDIHRELLANLHTTVGACFRTIDRIRTTSIMDKYVASSLNFNIVTKGRNLQKIYIEYRSTDSAKSLGDKYASSFRSADMADSRALFI